MLSVRVTLLEGQAFFDRHGRAETGLDTVPGTQAFDLGFDIRWQAVVGHDHVRPHGVAAHGRAFQAAQHRAHRRVFAPGGIGVPGILVAVHRGFRRLVDLYQARVVGVAADHRVVLQLAEAPGERYMLGVADVLVAQEQHAVLEQLLANFGEQPIVMDGVGQVQADQFRTDGAGQLFDLHDVARP
ncbi:hypothetical protein D3C76_1332180 [compost metagenome]